MQHVHQDPGQDRPHGNQAVDDAFRPSFREEEHVGHLVRGLVGTECGPVCRRDDADRPLERKSTSHICGHSNSHICGYSISHICGYRTRRDRYCSISHICGYRTRRDRHITRRDRHIAKVKCLNPE